MTEVLLFHHALGLTPGVCEFADKLRVAGHIVHTPDLFDARTFSTIAEGMAHIEAVGFNALRARGEAIANVLHYDLVYAGFSFGVLPAQKLAQTRPGARGAFLISSCIPISGEWAFGPWPEGVPVQIHGMDEDPIFMGEGDVQAAREIVDKVPGTELYLYPGNQHLFVEKTVASYDAAAAELLLKRATEFLGRLA